MTDDLFSFLVRDLDEDRNISDDVIGHVERYAVALIQSLIVPEHVAEDWPDFFSLVEAFVLACGSPRLGYLARRSFLFVTGGGDPLTDGDREFLVALVDEMHERLSPREA